MLENDTYLDSVIVYVSVPFTFNGVVVIFFALTTTLYLGELIRKGFKSSGRILGAKGRLIIVEVEGIAMLARYAAFPPAEIPNFKVSRLPKLLLTSSLDTVSSFKFRLVIFVVLTFAVVKLFALFLICSSRFRVELISTVLSELVMLLSIGILKEMVSLTKISSCMSSVILLQEVYTMTKESSAIYKVLLFMIVAR